MTKQDRSIVSASQTGESSDRQTTVTTSKHQGRLYLLGRDAA